MKDEPGLKAIPFKEKAQYRSNRSARCCLFLNEVQCFDQIRRIPD